MANDVNKDNRPVNSSEGEQQSFPMDLPQDNKNKNAYLFTEEHYGALLDPALKAKFRQGEARLGQVGKTITQKMMAVNAIESDITAAKSEATEEIARGLISQMGGQVNTTSGLSHIARETIHASQGGQAYASIGRTTAERERSMLRSSSYREDEIRSAEANVSRLRIEKTGMLDRSPEELNRVEKEIQKNIAKSAGLRREQKESALAGLSEDKLLKRADTFEKQNLGKSEKESWSTEAQSKSVKELQAAYSAASTEYKTAADKLRTAIEEETKAREEGKENLETFTKAVDDAKAGLSKAEKEKDKAEFQVEAKEDSFRAGFKKFQRGMGIANVVGDIVNNSVAAYKDFTFGSEMRKADVKVGAMSRTNELYFKSKQAIFNDDVGAMMDVVDAGGASKYANEKVTSTANKIGSTTNFLMSGAGAALAAGAILTATGVGATIGVPLMIAAGAAGAATQAGNVKDAFNGTTDASQRLQAYDKYMALAKEERAVGTDQMQAYYSQGLTLYRNTQGLGGGGRGLQKSLLDSGVLSKLAEQGVSASEAAQLASSFRSAGAFKASDAESVMANAGTAAAKGVLSKSEYVSLSANMMGAGGQAGDLQNILTFAVAKGMDNSKAIGEMVEATMSMSGDLASQGIAASSAVQDSLMSTIVGLDAQGFDKNLSTKAAQNMMMATSSVMKDRSINLGNLMETDMIRKTLGAGYSSGQVERIGEMGLDQWSMIQKAARGGASEKEMSNLQLMLKNKGIYSAFFDESGSMKGDQVNQIRKAAFSGIAGRFWERGDSGQAIGQEFMGALDTGDPKEIAKLLKNEKVMSAMGEHVYSALGFFQQGGLTEEQKKGKEAYDTMQKSAASESDKTKAQAEAEMIKLGEKFAEKLSDGQKDAMKTITELMKTLKDTHIKTSGEMTSKAGEVNEIVTSLKGGATQFKNIIEGTAERLKDLDMDIPSSDN